MTVALGFLYVDFRESEEIADFGFRIGDRKSCSFEIVVAAVADRGR
jgi:hypothetical protein